MKKILSVILACCLVSSCGGGGRQEPLLKDGIESPEVPADVLQKADKPSKTGKGLIITSVVLGAGFAVSVIGNIYFYRKNNELTKMALDMRGFVGVGNGFKDNLCSWVDFFRKQMISHFKASGTSPESPLQEYLNADFDFFKIRNYRESKPPLYDPKRDYASEVRLAPFDPFSLSRLDNDQPEEEI